MTLLSFQFQFKSDLGREVAKDEWQWRGKMILAILSIQWIEPSNSFPSSTINLYIIPLVFILLFLVSVCPRVRQNRCLVSSLSKHIRMSWFVNSFPLFQSFPNPFFSFPFFYRNLRVVCILNCQKKRKTKEKKKLLLERFACLVCCRLWSTQPITVSFQFQFSPFIFFFGFSPFHLFVSMFVTTRFHCSIVN